MKLSADNQPPFPSVTSFVGKKETTEHSRLFAQCRHCITSLICPPHPSQPQQWLSSELPPLSCPSLYPRCPSLLLRLPASHLSFRGQLTPDTVTLRSSYLIWHFPPWPTQFPFCLLPWGLAQCLTGGQRPLPPFPSDCECPHGLPVSAHTGNTADLTE